MAVTMARSVVSSSTLGNLEPFVAKSSPKNEKSNLKLIMESFPLHVWPYAPVLAILGAIVFAQRTYGCPSDDELDKFFPLLYHTVVCGGPRADVFRLGRIERIVLFVFAVIGVFGYVIPKHMKQDGAKRLYVNNKVTRVLLIHIVTGLFTVLGSGLMGIFAGGIKPGSTTFYVFGFVELLHELTILRLLKNHDGIFAIRADNATAGFAKFQALLNASRYTPVAMADTWFLASWGFMGTRIGGLLSYIIMQVTKEGDGIFLEHTYSIGVSLAIHHIVGRAQPYGTGVWLVVLPAASFFYYHELWSRKFKAPFVATVLVISLLMLQFTNSRVQFLYMIAFHFWTFTKPMYYRLPKLALAGTIDNSAKTKKAVVSDPVLRSIYRRDSFKGISSSSESLDSSFSMERAAKSAEESLPAEYREGLKFRGSKAWVPSASYLEQLLLDESDVSVDDSEDSGCGEDKKEA